MRSLYLAAIFAAFVLTRPSLAAAGPRDANLTGVINLNTATETELQLLPGIGAKKAERIIEVRQKRKFENPEQIRRVKGIGRGTFRRLKPYLAVNGNTTLAVGSDAGATLTETKETTPPPAKTNAPAAPAKTGTKPAKTPVAPKAPARA